MKWLAVWLLFMSVLIGCSAENNNVEYENIKDSDLTGQDLLVTLTNFELENASHFASKIDLGSYYVLTGNYERAWEYLRRAEVLISEQTNTEEDKKSITTLYGLLAQIELYNGNYSEAESYAKMAVDTHTVSGEEYMYILGQSQLTQDKNEEALNTFDTVFENIPGKANAEDLRAYMYLLASAERFDDCVPILERFFETGNYFLGLGLFASSVYENVNEVEKSILSAFLDYEFNSNYNGYDNGAFLDNLNNLESVLQSNGTYDMGLPALSLVRSIYTDVIINTDSFSTFFATRFCVLNQKLQSKTLTFEDFLEYLTMEKYFTRFPVYYLNAWNMVLFLSPEDLPNYTVLLEKIIALRPSEFYVIEAKHSLGALIGLSKRESEWILTESELQNILFEYATTGNHELFNAVFELLQLPDNDYVINALQLLRNTKEQYYTENILRVTASSATDRLKERIEYILQ